MSRSAVMAKAAAAARGLAEALAELAEDPETARPNGNLYDSANPPPRTSRRRFAELCRAGRVPGAYREGRHWVCARDVWHAARRQRVSQPGSPTQPPSLIQRADELLRRRGLRVLPKVGCVSHDRNPPFAEGNR